MGSITDYLEDEWLDHFFNAAYASPTTVYLALCTGAVDDTATGTLNGNEVANSGSYARTAISFGTAAARVITQDADVDFPQATGNWGTVSYWAIVDSATWNGGNCLAYGQFGTSKAVNTDDTPSVASGEVNVTVTAGAMSNYAALEVLDHTFDNAAFATTAGSTFIGMWTAALSDSSTGATAGEPAGGSYAREEVDLNGGVSPTWSIAASGAVTTLAAVTFTTATASWGTISYMGITDVVTTGAGNLLFYADMTDKLVDNGDTAEFATGDIDVSIS